MDEKVWVVNNNKYSTNELISTFAEFAVETIETQQLKPRLLDCTEQEWPSLIVVSARQSPGEPSGFFLIKQIKKVCHKPMIPVVVISSDSDINEEKEALNAGADDYFYEPLSPALVTVKVKSLIAYYVNLRQQLAQTKLSWSKMESTVDQLLQDSVVAVVDDEIKHREVIEAALLHRYKVIGFASGVAALEACQSEPVNLMILDIKMPEMDGYQVIQAIKSSDYGQSISVVFGTGKTRVKQIIKGIECGAVDYLQKPYAMEVVAARVASLLRRGWRGRVMQNTKLVGDVETNMDIANRSLT